MLGKIKGEIGNVGKESLTKKVKEREYQPRDA